MRFTLFSISIILFASGCASIELPPPIPETPEEIAKAKEVWQKIDERNSKIESSAEWINNSYKGIQVKALANVPVERYADYNKFLDDGRIYVINHPGFFTFFQLPKINRQENVQTKNIMDIFIDKDNIVAENSAGKSNTSRFSPNIINVLREFEKTERNFLEFKSTEKKLVILILPGNYKKYSSYRYKNGYDEYSRYINDVTNDSESVLYVESKKPNNGKLTDEDISTFVEFLQKIGATSVMLGGEYIGRCQEDFYKQLAGIVGKTITVEIVPELSPPSPEDMNSRMKALLDSENKLDFEAAAYNILKNRYGSLESAPKLRRVKSSTFYNR